MQRPDTSWNDSPHQPEDVPYGAFWPRPAVLSSTVARIIEAMTEELRGSEFSTGGCLTVYRDALRDLVPLRPLGGGSRIL